MDKPYNSKESLVNYLKDNELVGLDSEFSGKNLELVKKFSAKGMDLNSWWVYTSTSWACPSCKRTKPEIVRLNQHGYLTGHLHEHHDHMSDFVSNEFTRISENSEAVVADSLAQKFIARTAPALSAYDSTIICSDCNSADVTAKKIVDAPKFFSFSPNEIGRFVIPKSNSEHEINTSSALQAWQECKATFQIRLKLITDIAKLASNNSHWYQPSMRTAEQTYNAGIRLITYYGLDKISPIRPEKLLYLPNKFSGSKNSWRIKKQSQKTFNSPTIGELQHLININNNLWNRVPDDWNCPICNRKKFECVRKSNKGKWTFIISTKKILYDQLSSNYYQSVKTCKDCCTTATLIGTEAEHNAGIKLPVSSALVSPVELSKVVIANPHSKHTINNGAVDKLLIDISIRIHEGKFYGSVEIPI